MTSYIITRHAQSQHNKGSSKNLDSALTDKGLWQAERLAEELQKFNLTGFVMRVSPFLRCLKTASKIKEKINIPTYVDPLLSEALSSNYSGVFIPRRQFDFPQYDWSRFVGAGFLQHHEDGREFFPRVKAAKSSCADKKCVIVSHGMFCLALAKAVAHTLTEKEGWDDSIGNASITHVHDRQILKWGCTKHLKEAECKIHQ